MLMLLLFCIQVNDADKLMADRVLAMAANQGYQSAIELLDSEYGKTPYQFGNDLAQRLNRPKAAAAWFKGLLKEVEKKDEYIFGLAWSLWLQQDTKGALKTVGGLLASPDRVVQSRANYLVAQIHFRLSKLDLAEKHYRTAIASYQSIKYYGGVFACSLELANLLIGENRYDEVRVLIENAERANELLVSELHLKPNHAGKIFTTRFIMAFRQGAFKEALTWAQKAVEPYDNEGNLGTAGLCRIRVGLCQAFLGQMKEAEDTAQMVDEFAAKHDLEMVSVYNMLIWTYLNRCRGLDTDLFVREIEEWSKAHDDAWLIEVMKSIQKVKCPE